jgi:hypothetical protein
MRFYAAGRGDFLLQEDGVRVGRRTTEVGMDFLVGKTVSEVRDPGRIVFDAGTEPIPRLYADVGQALCAAADGQPLSLTNLVGHVVASASSRGGVLSLTFRDGVTLRCDPHPEYEAWEVEGGESHSFIVCCPGGELAVWDDAAPVAYGQLRERDPATAAALDELFEQYNLPRPSGYPPPSNHSPRRS